MRRRVLRTSVLLDLAALLLGLEVASLVVFGTPFPWHFRSDVWPMLGGIAGGGLVGILLAIRTGRNGVPRPSYGRAFVATGAALLASSSLIVFGRTYWSRPYLATAIVAAFVVMIAHRTIRRMRPWSERIILITNEKALADHIRDAEHVEVVDFLDPSGIAPAPPEPGVTIAVDLRAVLSDDMAQFVSSCSMAGYPMRGLIQVYEEHTGRLPIVHLLGGWELTVPLADRRLYVRVKRVIDTVLVTVTAPVWLLLGAIIGLAVRVDSKGPVIFSQPRIGLDGKPFTLYKFRTMVGEDDPNQPKFASHGDERLTRVGKFLRRFRIDEIPQLWNVLRGDLSLVGPRPEQAGFVEYFSRTIPFYEHRHLVRPGVTGWAQVNYGYADDEADTIDKLSYDLFYIKHVSPWLDLEILGQSVWTVMSGFGAR